MVGSKCLYSSMKSITECGIGRNHPSSHGGTQDLVYMRVHDEGAMFEDEIEYYAHYIGWWVVGACILEKMFCVFGV